MSEFDEIIEESKKNTDEERFRRSDQKIEKKKKRKGINLMFLLLLIFLIIYIFRIMYNPTKYNNLKKGFSRIKKQITSIINRSANKEDVLEIDDENTKNEKAEIRINNLKKAIVNRQKKIILAKESKDKIQKSNYLKVVEDILDANRFIQTLLFDKVISKEEGDVIKNNTIIINNRRFKINSYEIVDDNIVDKNSDSNNTTMSISKPKNLEYPVIEINLDQMDAQIINNEIVLRKDSKGRPIFDPLYDNLKKRYVFAKDKKDGDISNKIVVKYSEKMENWKAGNKYKVIYEVTNSRNLKAKKELTLLFLKTNM